MSETIRRPIDTLSDSDSEKVNNWDDVQDALLGLRLADDPSSEFDQMQPPIEIATEEAEPESDERIVSPIGAKILSAALRINSRLEKRALNREHKQAISEDRERTVEIQDEVYATYKPNFNYYSERDEAFRINDRLAREAARQEMIERAKSKMRRIGQSARRGLKETGLISLGLTVTGVNKAEEIAGKAGRKMEGAIETGIHSAAETIESAKEARSYQRQAAKDRKERALERKYERHAKIMQRRRAIGNFILRSRETGQSALDTWKDYPTK